MFTRQKCDAGSVSQNFAPGNIYLTNLVGYVLFHATRLSTNFFGMLKADTWTTLPTHETISIFVFMLVKQPISKGELVIM